MSQYDPAILDEALAAVKEGLMSVRGAAQHFDIPKSTIYNRIKEVHSAAHGRPTILTDKEETYICEMVKQAAEWGFPFTEVDLRHFVKTFLDKKGVVTRDQ